GAGGPLLTDRRDPDRFSCRTGRGDGPARAVERLSADREQLPAHLRRDPAAAVPGDAGTADLAAPAGVERDPVPVDGVFPSRLVRPARGGDARLDAAAQPGEALGLRL